MAMINMNEEKLRRSLALNSFNKGICKIRTPHVTQMRSSGLLREY